MVQITISLDDTVLEELRLQAEQTASTPETIAARIVAERLTVPHPSPEVRAIISRQLRDYERAFDRLAE